MQHLFWIIPVLVLLAVGMIIILVKRSNVKLRKRIESEFGRIPEHDDFDIESINGCHFYSLKNNTDKEYIDDITWNDLNMDDVYKRLDNCQTSIGQECLYSKLHEVCFDEESRMGYNSLTDMLRDEEKRKYAQLYLSKLGKSNFSISSLVFKPKQYKLKLPSFVYTILTISVILIVAAAIVSAVLSLSVTGLLFILAFINLVANVVLYYMTKLRLESQLNMMRYLSSALWTCKKILKLPADGNEEYFKRLKEETNKLKFIRSRLSGRAAEAVSEADYLKEFYYMIFLVDIRRYNKSIKLIINNRSSVEYVYRFLGEIDTAINTLSFIKSIEHSCRPEFCDENIVDFDEIFHPLIEKPITNSEVFDRNVVITGANATGKSTFIKAVAVNNILAMSLNVCCAKRYKLKRSLTITSMAQRDDIIKGESYYIAELKSLKRIIDRVDKVYCCCFIDEILKGTNTTERIAASVSALGYLSQKSCFCMTATHDTQIAQSLEGEYKNYHFEESISDNDIVFDYKLKEGIARSKNAIKLLRFFDYPKEIIDRANKNVGIFDSRETKDER